MRTLILLLAISAFANAAERAVPAKGPSRKPAHVETKSQLAEIFIGYLQCAGDVATIKSLDPIRQCVKPLVNPSLSSSQIDRLTTWLLMQPQVTTIRDCTAHELSLGKAFPEATGDALCFELKTDREIKSGIAYFKKIKSQFYLHSFDY